MKTVAAAAAMMALGACGGGSDSSQMGFTAAPAASTGPSATTIADAAANANRVTENQTGPTRLPGGQATFRGVSFFRLTTASELAIIPELLGQQLVNQPDLVGDVTLTADFNQNRVTGGSMGNFRNQAGSGGGGSVRIGSATILRTPDPEFTATVSGTIDFGTGRPTVTGSGPLEGEFIGPNAEIAVGAGGLISASPLPGAPVALGGFIAER